MTQTAANTAIVLDPHQVIFRPLVTEKGCTRRSGTTPMRSR